jgi:rhomboid protease GluP
MAGETFRERVKQAPITFAICAVNVLAFVFVETPEGSTSVATLVRVGALERSHVWAGEYFRFVTPMFLHIGWTHLLWNTYCLVGWCAPVERVLGRARFLFTYLATGMGACAVSLLCHDAPGGAGASGAAFGIVAMTMALRWRALGGFEAFVADRWVRSTASMIVLWTVIGVAAKMMDNFAHGGGFLTGAVVGAVLVGTATQPRWVKVLAIIAFLVALTTLLAAAAHRWPGERSMWEEYQQQRTGAAQES